MAGCAGHADQVTAWFRWYSDAVVAALGWQVAVLRGLGFAGDRRTSRSRDGARCRPTSPTRSRTGSASTGPDGALGRGLDYPAQFPALARLDAGPRAAW